MNSSDNKIEFKINMFINITNLSNIDSNVYIKMNLIFFCIIKSMAGVYSNISLYSRYMLEYPKDLST